VRAGTTSRRAFTTGVTLGNTTQRPRRCIEMRPPRQETLMTIPVFAQTMAEQAAERAGAAASTTTSLMLLAAVLLTIAAIWKVFERAGEPGWAVLVPFYNLYVLTKVAQVSGWWVLAMFIPFLGIVAAFVIAIGVAKRFGKSSGFGIGIALLPFLFYPMLAWGDGEASPSLA